MEGKPKINPSVKTSAVKVDTAVKGDIDMFSDTVVEEDVPSDFFDVFSNNDFMAGLDIVDAWDETEAANDSRKHKNDANNMRRAEKRHSSSRTRKSDEGREEKDRRRDPEKTKRDILKDKSKCAKDKEARIISEKLKVCETGLVPPGMEMEVDLQEITKNSVLSDKIGGKQPSMKKEKERHRKSKSIENFRGRRFISPIRRSPVRRKSPLRHKSPIRITRISPVRPRDHRPSPGRSHRVRGNYRGRSRSRSPFRHRKSYGRDSYDERNRRHSPVVKRKNRDLSTDRLSNISDREMWLRHKERRLSSPIDEFSSSKRSNDFLEEIAIKLKEERRKKSKLLKEIREELNDEASRPKYLSPVPEPISHHVPPQFMPGPQHPQFFQQPPVDPLSQYDEQYFIGQCPTMMPNFNQPPNFGNQNYVPMIPFQQQQQPFFPNPVQAGEPSPNFNDVQSNNFNIITRNNVQVAARNEQTINKLFEDKKISLSDFLSVTANNTDSTPINLQKKIQVISLCQDAIKSLGGESKLGGRFFAGKCAIEAEAEDSKDTLVSLMHPSPLRKIPIIRFDFTTPSKYGPETTSLQSTVSKLLSSLGLAEHKPIPKVVHKKPSVSPLNPVPHNSPKLTLIQNKANQGNPPRKFPVDPFKPSDYDTMSGKTLKMKMCQTDPFICDVCNDRRKRKFESIAIQCDIEYVDNSTQTTEEDRPHTGLLRTPPKNQSLALLTPAQLLKESSFGGSRPHLNTPQDTPQDRKFQYGDFSTKQNTVTKALDRIYARMNSTLGNQLQKAKTVEPSKYFPQPSTPPLPLLNSTLVNQLLIPKIEPNEYSLPPPVPPPPLISSTLGNQLQKPSIEPNKYFLPPLMSSTLGNLLQKPSIDPNKYFLPPLMSSTLGNLLQKPTIEPNKYSLPSPVPPPPLMSPTFGNQLQNSKTTEPNKSFPPPLMNSTLGNQLQNSKTTKPNKSFPPLSALKPLMSFDEIMPIDNSIKFNGFEPMPTKRTRRKRKPRARVRERFKVYLRLKEENRLKKNVVTNQKM